MSSGACLLPTKASSRSRKYNRSSLRWRSSRCRHWWGKDATSRCGSLQAPSASCHCRTQVRSLRSAVRLRLSPSSTCRGAHLSRCAVRHRHCQDRRWPALGHPPPSEALLALHFLHLSYSRPTPHFREMYHTRYLGWPSGHVSPTSPPDRAGVYYAITLALRER
jgi:hypothetical protein